MKRRTTRFAICIKNKGYPASLEVRKLYAVLEDRAAEKRNLVRVIDESGEDYLYPANYFADLEITPELHRKVLAAR